MYLWSTTTCHARRHRKLSGKSELQSQHSPHGRGIARVLAYKAVDVIIRDLNLINKDGLDSCAVSVLGQTYWLFS
jgi:hypothetical protein